MVDGRFTVCSVVKRAKATCFLDFSLFHYYKQLLAVSPAACSPNNWNDVGRGGGGERNVIKTRIQREPPRAV
jgi:hypothetical protein